MKIMQEKNFGPILPVKSFLNEEDAIIFANDIKNKYAGAVFSNVEKEAVLLAQKLNCNAVAINDVILANRFQGKETNSNIMTEILLPRIGDFSIKKFLRHKPILISNPSAKNTLWY
jgi:acyl-CoA reductase-like NAD-dependent aldehyde dehydrogenase